MALRSFQEANSKEWRIRCTMQVCTTVSGKTALIASGKSFTRPCAGARTASAVAQHGVKRGDHLAHDGDKDDLGLLAGSGETGRHVEDISHRHAAAVYA